MEHQCTVLRPSSGRSREVPLSWAIVDDKDMYEVVLKHLESCGHCDPGEVLTRYLARRKSESRFGGMTTATFARFVLRCERKLPGRIPEDLVSEILVRAGPKVFLKYRKKVRGHAELVWEMLVSSRGPGPLSFGPCTPEGHEDVVGHLCAWAWRNMPGTGTQMPPIWQVVRENDVAGVLES
jgi:hypothetical protein